MARVSRARPRRAESRWGRHRSSHALTTSRCPDLEHRLRWAAGCTRGDAPKPATTRGRPRATTGRRRSREQVDGGGAAGQRKRKYRCARSNVGLPAQCRPPLSSFGELDRLIVIVTFLHARETVFGFLRFPLHIKTGWTPGGRPRARLEDRPCLDQIGKIESFGKPSISRLKDLMALASTST